MEQEPSITLIKTVTSSNGAIISVYECLGFRYHVIMDHTKSLYVGYINADILGSRTGCPKTTFQYTQWAEGCIGSSVLKDYLYKPVKIDGSKEINGHYIHYDIAIHVSLSISQDAYDATLMFVQNIRCLREFNQAKYIKFAAHKYVELVNDRLKALNKAAQLESDIRSLSHLSNLVVSGMDKSEEENEDEYEDF